MLKRSSEANPYICAPTEESVESSHITHSQSVNVCLLRDAHVLAKTSGSVLYAGVIIDTVFIELCIRELRYLRTVRTYDNALVEEARFD
jgi:hypothetical protein